MSNIDIGQIDLNLLKVFEALYEEGGASRAAIRLGLTQSAVSAALGRLRQMYQDPLFQRTGRGLAPTRRANELKPLVSEALNRCRQTLALVSGTSAWHGRTVTIGLSDDYEIAMGPRLIQEVAERAPGIRLVFRQTHSQIVADMLMGRAIDLAITAGGLTSRLLGRHLLGTGSYSCLLAAPVDRLTLNDFIRYKHLLISSGGFTGIVDEALSRCGQVRQCIASTTHFASVPFLMQGGEMLVTLPTHAARAIARLGGLHMVACPLPMPEYPIELGWRTDALRDEAIQLVRACVEAVGAELY